MQKKNERNMSEGDKVEREEELVSIDSVEYKRRPKKEQEFEEKKKGIRDRLTSWLYTSYLRKR